MTRTPSDNADRKAADQPAEETLRTQDSIAACEADSQLDRQLGSQLTQDADLTDAEPPLALSDAVPPGKNRSPIGTNITDELAARVTLLLADDPEDESGIV